MSLIEWNKARKGKTLEETFGVEQAAIIRQKFKRRQLPQCQPQRVKVTCRYCKSEFSVRPAEKKRRRFCSRKCSEEEAKFNSKGAKRSRLLKESWVFWKQIPHFSFFTPSQKLQEVWKQYRYLKQKGI